MKFGIVQGRLTPSKELQAFPKDWQKEFWQASVLGIDYIELISEREHNQDNPIWDYTGKSINGYQCPILCNDYIIDHSLNDDPAARMDFKLIEQANLIGSKLIVLPLFEHSYSTSKQILLDIELMPSSTRCRLHWRLVRTIIHSISSMILATELWKALT